MVKIELGGRLPSSLHPKSQGLPNGYNKYTGVVLVSSLRNMLIAIGETYNKLGYDSLTNLNSDLIICTRYRLQSGSQV